MSLAWYRRHLWETITYWAAPTADVWNDSTFSTPSQVEGRWEDRHEEFIDWRGELGVSNAIVYLGSEPELQGYLYKGTSSSTTPKTLDEAFPIRRVDRLGGYRESDGYIYVAYL